MNFLAHSFLSPATPHALVGNLLGDFCKGIDASSLHPEIKSGLDNHRYVDKYTDHHPLVKDARRLFSDKRRRFSGIVLDVLFDHYLIKHWQKYSEVPFITFKQQTYQLLEAATVYMPEHMAQVMTKVVSQDWFESYQTLDGIGFALDRIASRIRFTNQFQNSIEEITALDKQLEQVFLAFFPQLLQQNKWQSTLASKASS